MVAAAESPGAALDPSSWEAAKVEFACPRCGRPVRTPATAAGKKGKCPSCGVEFTLEERYDEGVDDHVLAYALPVK